MLNIRTFTLADGVEKTSTFPAAGGFLIPITVLAVLAASLAPALRGADENGLNQAGGLLRTSTGAREKAWCLLIHA